MSGYRLGDRHIVVAGVETRLRLTVSALAEIVSRLDAETPAALAERLRGATDAEWNIVLQAFSEPRPNAPLSQADLVDILPDLSAALTDGLTP